MSKQTVLVAWTILLGAASALAVEKGTFRVRAEGVDPAVEARIQNDLALAETRIEGMLGEFRETVSVRILPSRAKFSQALAEAWGMSETACWMVGGADDRVLYLLSPGVWGEEACEHDPADREHLRLLVIHEAVHVLHGQVNPSDDLGLLTEIGWFTEGLATYVSGQLEARHSDSAAEAIADGETPSRLRDAWSGPHRYGVAGSMVAFVDEVWGRSMLRSLLSVTSEAELLSSLDVTEEEFLDAWMRWAAVPALERPGPS